MYNVEKQMEGGETATTTNKRESPATTEKGGADETNG